MVEIQSWMEALKTRLLERFGGRLLFLGLQGSYGRGEAGEDSDIDVVAVLDRAELADLDAYRAIVSQMPEGEKACGFLCGEGELKSWPRFDLLSLVRDTRAVHGALDGLLPPMGRAELAHGAAVGASGLYHAACHTWLYAPKEERPGFLKQANKSAFFVLRTLHELRTGERVRTRRELLDVLTGDERALLAPEAGEEPEAAFARLLRWASAAMAEAQRAKAGRAGSEPV